MTTRRFLTRLALGACYLLAAALVLAGCGSPALIAAAPVSYAPSAYGQSGQCYYVDDPAEAVALLAAGLCPSGWIPTPMPLTWHETYASYYDSPAYYRAYVPVRRQTLYVTQVQTFEVHYHSQITTATRTARWKGSDGKVVVGTSPKTFRSGRTVTSGSRSGSGSLVQSAARSGTPVRVGSGGGTFRSGRTSTGSSSRGRR